MCRSLKSAVKRCLRAAVETSGVEGAARREGLGEAGWETLASGLVEERDEACHQIHKMNAGGQGVGEARSSEEVPVIGAERRGLGRTKRTQKEPELIG